MIKSTKNLVMKRIIQLFTLIVSILVLNLNKSFAQFSNDCQNEELSGKYLLISESDGKSPKNGAVIALFLSGKEAKIHATMPGTDIISGGEFHACNNIISISFDEFDFKASSEGFSLVNNTLTMPFQVLGGEGGSSTWQKVSTSEENPEDSFVNNEEGGGGLTPDNSNPDNNNNNPDNNNPDNNTPDDNSDDDNSNNNPPEENTTDEPGEEEQTNPYAGNYVGTAWGWEVRFKHTSGDFVSQFSGVDKSKLPFKGDKTIMSLMVQHAAEIKIHIDEDNNVTGEGEIVYSLIPNLCGLAVLTEQVNSAVNLLSQIDFFFKLGDQINGELVKKFEGKFLGLSGKLGKSLKMSKETGKSLFDEYYLGKQIVKNVKDEFFGGQKSNALCNCAAGHAAISGGNKVGPSTLQEMINTLGPEAVKAVLMDDILKGNLPLGLMLSLPGVTQIQYEYKGLINGPETRKFKIKGHLADNQLYLEMDGDVSGGSNKLQIEYTVNYKSERPTFPIWTPFMDAPGEMFPAGSIATLHERVEKTKKGTYVDANNNTKTIDVPYVETVEEKVPMPIPFAIFKKSGKQRNGVKVWHEYEYSWNLFKEPLRN